MTEKTCEINKKYKKYFTIDPFSEKTITLRLATQDTTFQMVKHKLTRSFQELTNYYINNQLRPNPDNTQVCNFHIQKREAKRELKVEWFEKSLRNTEHLVYLGVTLDRTLTFKEHCKKIKMKVEARNNLIRKLTGIKWGELQIQPLCPLMNMLAQYRINLNIQNTLTRH